MTAPMRRAVRSVLKPGATAAAALALALGAGACESLLDVDEPGLIPADRLNDPSRAVLLVNGAIADFECALGAYVVMGGLIGEEFVDATQTADRWPYDRREVLPSDRRYSTFGCEALGVYPSLSTARFTADDVLAKLEGWRDDQMPQGADRTVLIATAAAYSGYAHLLLGEGFCSAAVDGGPELFPADFFALAVQRFTRAIDAATAAGPAADDLRYMALVGRARARLNLGEYAAAAADAALVPAGFEAQASASNASSRRQNRVVAQNGEGTAVSVGPEYRELTVEGEPDTRVPVVNTGTVATDGTPIWVQEKYDGLGAPLPIATYEEAQLIRAEAALRGGDPAAAVAIIDALRMRRDLPAYSGAVTAAAVMDLLVMERRRELFLEGHHLYDAIRFDLDLQPAPGTPFAKGGTYGTTRCLPLPDVERLNNPNVG